MTEPEQWGNREDDPLRHETEWQRWEEEMEWREHNRKEDDEQQS